MNDELEVVMSSFKLLFQYFPGRA